MPYKRMVDEFKKYFVDIKFEQIPRVNNKVVKSMVTIVSLLQIENKQNCYEFLVEQLFSPTYDNSKSQVSTLR